MPKLQTFNAGAVRAPVSNVRADPAAFGGAIGAAISGTTIAIDKLARHENEKQTDIARDYISTTRNTLTLSAQQYAIDNPDATADDKASYFDEQSQQFTDGSPNDIASAALGRNIDDIKFKAISQANVVDATRDVERRVDSINTSINTNANIVQNDPSTLDAQLSEVIGHIDNSTLLNENSKRDIKLQAQQALVNSALGARLTNDSKFYDPASVLKELQSGKYDSVLDDKQKAAFINKATVESDKQSFTQSVGLIQNDFPVDEDRLQYLTTTNAVDIEKKYGIKANDAMRLAADTRSKISFGRNEDARAALEIKIANSNAISKLVADGKIDEAEALVRDSDSYPTITEKNSIILGIRAESAKTFDPRVFHNAETDIVLQKIKDPSQIDALHTTAKNKAVLKQQLDDQRSNEGRFNYFESFKKRYDTFLRSNPSVDVPFAEAAAIVLDKARQEGISVYDSRINDLVKPLLSPDSSVDTGFFSRRNFGIENAINGEGQNALVEIPSDVTEGQIAATMEKFVMTRQEVIDNLSKRNVK